MINNHCLSERESWIVYSTRYRINWGGVGWGGGLVMYLHVYTCAYPLLVVTYVQRMAYAFEHSYINIYINYMYTKKLKGYLISLTCFV